MLMVCCARVILAVIKFLIVLKRVYGEWCVELEARRRRSRVAQCPDLHASRQALKGSLPVRARLATFTSASRTDRCLTHFTPHYMQSEARSRNLTRTGILQYSRQRKS